ncbi:MAG TPA: acetylxylan esterase, partial [Streptomyces sp.]
MLTDLDLPALWAYRSAHREPADFDAFWARTLDEARTHPLKVELTPVDVPLETVEVFDLTFTGYGGHPVR